MDLPVGSSLTWEDMRTVVVLVLSMVGMVKPKRSCLYGPPFQADVEELIDETQTFPFGLNSLQRLLSSHRKSFVTMYLQTGKVEKIWRVFLTLLFSKRHNGEGLTLYLL